MARKPRNKREQTRLTLIEATIQSIVEIGLPDTTVTSIMQRAGLSRGMLHLHFVSKDELLEATAAFFAEDYYEKQEAFLKNVGKDPISRLKAMIDADFSEELLNQTTAIVWYALRSVAHTNEAIRQHATTRDQRLLDAYNEIFKDLVLRKNGKQLRAIELAYGLVAMTEGMWMDFFLFPANFNRKKAKEIVLTFVTSQIDMS